MEVERWKKSAWENTKNTNRWLILSLTAGSVMMACMRWSRSTGTVSAAKNYWKLRKKRKMKKSHIKPKIPCCRKPDLILKKIGGKTYYICKNCSKMFGEELVERIDDENE
jgi:transposase-like protein